MHALFPLQLHGNNKHLLDENQVQYQTCLAGTSDDRRKKLIMISATLAILNELGCMNIISRHNWSID